MLGKYYCIALIPARAGSKGLADKNLLRVGGKSLLQRAIKCGKDSTIIDRTIVSSDSDKILAHAVENGAEVIKRPSKLAADDSHPVDVVKHFLQEVGTLDLTKVLVIYLQPTSPFRTSQHVNSALQKIVDGRTDSVVSVCHTEKPPFKMLGYNEEKETMSLLFPRELTNQRRQDLPSTVLLNGAIYIFSAERFLRESEFPAESATPYFMSKEDSIDIDTNFDLELANFIFSQKQNERKH